MDSATTAQLPAVHGSLAATARAIERPVMRCLEMCAAVLVAADIVILLIGVIARYAFRAPQIWTDDLAQAVFLWLGMIGATVALNRGEHMRMTALIVRAAPGPRQGLEAFAAAAGLVFLAAVIQPAIEYVQEVSRIEIPGLGVSKAWLTMPLPCGFALMIVIGVIRLFRAFTPAVALLLIGLAAAAAIFAPLADPWLESLGNLNLILFFVGMVGAAVLAGVPIAIAFAGGTFAYMVLTMDVPMLLFVGRFYEGMSHLILLAVPLFVFLGLLIEMTGMARAMVDFLASLLGHVRGGLSYVLVGAMYLVSGISGSKAADMAAVAPALFPEMIKRGAAPGDLVALLSATGAQTETVPPSLVLITIGSVTGVSIGALFTGGLLPSLVLAVGLCVVVHRRYRRQDLSGIRRATPAEVVRALVVALPALALPFVIRLTVVEGVATATEVSTIGIAYTIVIGLLVYRQFNWRRLVPMLVETASLSGVILLIVGAATSMAWALTQSGFSLQLASLMAGLPGGRFTFLAVSIVAFVVLGSVLEGIPVIVLFGPLLFPIAGKLGIHEVHYAMVTVLAMGIGLFAPPFGVGFYAAGAIGRIDPNLGIRPIVAYLVAMLVGLAVVAAVPWVSIGFL
ncbi:MAG TPA: TRAP transporter large permease subunit [Acetobacteraceae bacterium]|nr:TRAP transporter large permease subunit [Acetobacteraceae bacterium]